MIIDDKLHLIVFYDPLRLDRKALQSYGMIVEDFAPSLSIIYLRLNTVDDGYGSRCVLSVPGVLKVEHNKVMRGCNHSITLNDNFAFRNDLIYQELQLYDAWAVTKGDPRIKIGVIDSGVDMAHPDINCGVGGIFQYGIYSVNGHYPLAVDFGALTSNLGLNSESVELFRFRPDWLEVYQQQGWGALEPAVLYTDSTCTKTGWGSPYTWIKEPFIMNVQPDWALSYWEGAFGHLCMRDGFGHGTAIAGLISSPHNGNGFAGIAPDCTTLMYKWTDDSYAGSTMAACAAIKKAVDDGCHVITMSWGGPVGVVTDLLTATIQYAYNAGSLLIGSSGNNGQHPTTGVQDLTDWPAAYEEVVGVGGCGWNNPVVNQGYLDNEASLTDFSKLTPFAQKFPEVDLVAPCWGWTFHAPAEQRGLMWNNYFINKQSKFYSFMSDGGTSFSNPATGAVAALCMSKKLNIANITAQTIPLNAYWTPATAKGWLISGCRYPLGVGAGRLSANLALGAVV